MKKKLLALGLLAVTLLCTLTGCGDTKKIIASEEYDVDPNPPYAVDGTWVVPRQDRQITFFEDGVYTSTLSDEMNGSYAYYQDVKGFKLGEVFKKLSYVVLSDSKDKEQIFGAVMGDIFLGYWNQNDVYFLRENREILPVSELLGSWTDSFGGKYTMVLQENGVCQLGEADAMNDASYTYSEETGYLTIKEGNKKDKEYAVAMHQGYLFLMPVGNYYSMYLYQRS